MANSERPEDELIHDQPHDGEAPREHSESSHTDVIAEASEGPHTDSQHSTDRNPRGMVTAGGSPSHPSASASLEHSMDYDSDDSMPSLGTVSSSDTDTGDAAPVSRPSLQSLHTSNSRRARVDDAEDEDEQRETNRQRVTSPGAIAGEDSHDHHFHPDLHVHAQDRAHQPQPHSQQQPQQHHHRHPQPQQGADAGDAPRNLFNRIAVTVDWFPGGNAPIWPGPATVHGTVFGNGNGPGAGHAQFVPNAIELRFPFPAHAHVPPPANGLSVNAGGNTQTNTAQTGAHPNPPDLANTDLDTLLQRLRDSLGHIASFGTHQDVDGTPATGGPNAQPNLRPFPGFGPFTWGNVFAGLDMEEPDDPGRAKRLLSGLEEVPEGLVKRMERVGGELGDMPVCAVCFDSLLDTDALTSGGDMKDSHSHDVEHAVSGDVAMDVESESVRSSSSDIHNAIPSSSSSTASTSDTDPSPPSTSEDPAKAVEDEAFDHKIIVLPCAHVFHGACLRPWFTRPHRTTCPTCRFDIDPDSLTYVPPPRRPMHTSLRQEFAQARAAARARAATHANPPPYTPAEGQAPDASADATPPHPPNEPQPHAGQPPRTNAGPAPPTHPGFDMPLGLILDISMVVPGAAQRGPMNPPGPQPQSAPTPQQPGQQQQQPANPPPGPDASGPDMRAEAANNPQFRVLDQTVRGILGSFMEFFATGPGRVPRTGQAGSAPPIPAQQQQPQPQAAAGSATNVTAGSQLPTPSGAPRAFGPHDIHSLFTPPGVPQASTQSQEPQIGAQPQAGPAAPGATPQLGNFGGFHYFSFPARASRNGDAPDAAAADQTGQAQPQGPLPSFEQFMQVVGGIPEFDPELDHDLDDEDHEDEDDFFVHDHDHDHDHDHQPPAGFGAPAGDIPYAQAMQHFINMFGPSVPQPPTTRQGNDSTPATAPTPPIPPLGDLLNHAHPHAQGQPRPVPPGPIPFAVPAAPRPAFATLPPSPLLQNLPSWTRLRPQPPPEKRQWMPPAPPGPTLRERVEKKERELGLRCSDISCGLGPSDEDPVPVVDPRGIRQVHLRPVKHDGEAKDGQGDKACEHTFHPACLVSAERVAGWSGADEKQDKDTEGEEVQVSCPVCRAVGWVSREDWDEGACALA